MPFLFSLTFSPPSIRFARNHTIISLVIFHDEQPPNDIGQQGVVFAAKDRRTGAEVAVKRTHIGHYGSASARASAFTEIETLSYIDHPNVVKLLVGRG